MSISARWIWILLLPFVFVSSMATAEGGGHHHSAKSWREHWHGRPDSFAPLGVIGSHMHKAGHWMLSYRYARMRMDGNRDRTNNLSVDEVLALPTNYMAVPTKMDMEMHMFGVMYALTDWFTGMLMVPVTLLSMDHQTKMGADFKTSNDDIGDLKLSGLIRIWENEHHHVHANLGLSFPTGPIREKDTALTPMGPSQITLPFPMQTGSGTWDVLPGVTYLGHTDYLSWGAQAMGTIRPGRNSAGWAAGNRADVTSWVAVPLADWISASFRGMYQYWGNYSGDESRPPLPSQIETADPKLRGGRSVSLLGGINLYLPLGKFLGRNRFSVEAGAPVYQWLHGPQLKTRWQVTVGWQKSF